MSEHLTHRNRGRTYSYASFRPSIYSTGIDRTLPYTVNWAEGGMYGATDGGEDSILWSMTPDWLRGKLSGDTYDQHGGVITAPDGSQATAQEVSEAMGMDWVHDTSYWEKLKEAGQVAADRLPDLPGLPGFEDDEDACDEDCKKKKRRKAIIAAATATGLGLTVAVLLYRKKKYGAAV